MNSFALMLLFAIYRDEDYISMLSSFSQYKPELQFLIDKGLIEYAEPEDMQYSTSKKGMDLVMSIQQFTLNIE